jgi:rubrerythrin
MKDKPTLEQIREFMKIFLEEANQTLAIGEEVTNYQISAIQTYGEFLALIPSDKYKTVASTLAAKLKAHNSAFEERLYKMMNADEQKNEKEKLLKKSKSLRKDLVNPICESFNDNQKTYQQFLGLFDLYINELENFDIQEDDIRKTKILQAMQFAKPAKKSKTDLKNYLNKILKQYKIVGYSKNAKKLIDKLNELNF